MIKIPRGCVLWLDLTEDTGNIVYDHSGHGNNGKVYGAVLEKRLPLVGRRFDGVDDYVEVTHSDSLNITDEITIETWVNPYRLGTWARIVSKGDMIYGFERVGDANYFRFVVHVNETWRYSQKVAYEVYKWIHLAGTYSSSTRLIKLYVNGEFVTQTELTGLTTYKITSTTDPLQIGAGNNIRHFSGTIAHVSIYNRALTQKEIKYLYEEMQKRIFRRIAPLEIKMR